MLTRMIYTKIWEDEWFSELDRDEKFLFVYLLTNPFVNIIHAYECTERRICIDTNIKRSKVIKIKQKFDQVRKIRFYKSYVYLANAHRYEKYEGPSNEAAKYKLWSQLADDVQVWLRGLGYTPPTPPRHLT